MEFVRGRTLEQLLQSGSPFRTADVIDIGVELGRAVSAVHRAGLLHRDIKTHNVMRADDGRVVLMDFGTGRDLDDGTAFDIAGTPLYLAPELFQAKPATLQTDVYSLGVLLYRLAASYRLRCAIVRRSAIAPLDDLGGRPASTSSRRLDYMRRLALPSAVFVIAVLVPAVAAAQLEKGTDKKVCQAELEKSYLTKRMVALVSFPATAEGIDLSLDGKWDQKETSRRTKKSGGGIDIDDVATVTQVKLKDNLLEIQLNGGGFGTFGDFLSSSEKQLQERSVTGKASGGSRINLRFSRPIDCATLADPSAMMGFLAPLVRTDSLKQLAALKTIPPEWAEAAAQRRVVVGMEKATVFAIFGEPKQKQVDLAATPPIEKWQYDLPDLKTRIITFQNGKVTKIDEF